MRWIDVVTGGLVVLVLILVWGGEGRAHSFYDPKCCNGKDCGPVPDGTIREGSDGYQLPNGDILHYGDGRIMFSPDNHFHWCHGQQSTYCLYVPGRGA